MRETNENPRNLFSYRKDLVAFDGRKAKSDAAETISAKPRSDTTDVAVRESIERKYRVVTTTDGRRKRRLRRNLFANLAAGSPTECE